LLQTEFPYFTRYSFLCALFDLSATESMFVLVQPRGKAPGRAKGFHPKPATRHPIIRKTSKKGEKAQNGSCDLSCAELCFASHSSFFALSYERYGSATFVLVYLSFAQISSRVVSQKTSLPKPQEK
jgi:hypothetical protein